RNGFPTVSRKKVLSALQDGSFDWNRVLPGRKQARKDEMISKVMAVIPEIASPLFRQEVELIPGADEMLKAISSSDIRLGLVTSTRKMFMDEKLHPLRRAGIDQIFDAVITTDDAPKKKPAADPLIECAKRLSLEPNKMVYVGDAVVDIRAGKAAGTMTIGVLTGVDDHESLKAENPDALIDSVADLKDILAF
ncbi:MAG: HAD family hydrolase, partial [Deltaproteobacteria bacterium]|nr:HAD family hydrolase [Deltaproteobacteria bacterium]